MKRRHRMPFGTQVEPGGVRFRLWAPDAGRIELLLDGPWGERVHPMIRHAGGWYECLAEEAHAGLLYRYRVDDGPMVPDPASRCQPQDVHGPSEIVDPEAFDWQDGDWRGRPWEETVLYELHVGAFTEDGSFAAILEKLDHLVDLGVTAIELMPVADFPGRRGWGYDGVLLFAPDSSYGRPEDLKRLVQAAHARGLMVFLDVVYNHFGPDGNYLHAYAKRFFTDRHMTPWGKANNFDGPDSRPVRDFFIHNALYWIEEFHIDGLRLDAVHAILDDSDPHFLVELARRVRERAGAERHVHLVLENDDNAARFLERADGDIRLYDAQWNDDIHHVLHVLTTGESGGYYGDYADNPMRWLACALTEGFAYQGEVSAHRGGARRGEPSGHLPATAFVGFLQNHDQIGNRALGERITALAAPEAVRAAMAVLLLAPSPPLLFMGEEWAAPQPFLYFCDFHDELAEAVRDGRRREFASFPAFRDAKARERIPDPNAESNYTASKLDWADRSVAPHKDHLAFCRALLAVRRREIVPRLKGLKGGKADHDLPEGRVIIAHWRLADGNILSLLANLADARAAAIAPPVGRRIFATHDRAAGDALLPWSVEWHLGDGGIA